MYIRYMYMIMVHIDFQQQSIIYSFREKLYKLPIGFLKAK